MRDSNPGAFDFGQQLAQAMIEAAEVADYVAGLRGQPRSEAHTDLYKFTSYLLQPMGAANIAWASSPFGADPASYDSFSHAFSASMLYLFFEVAKPWWPWERTGNK
jgi:hypothetical protein